MPLIGNNLSLVDAKDGGSTNFVRPDPQFNPWSDVLSGDSGSDAVQGVVDATQGVVDDVVSGLETGTAGGLGVINQGLEPIVEHYDMGSSSDSFQDTIGGDATNIVASTSSPLSDYLKDHPGASGDELLRYMAGQNDEYGEKYMDYLLERESIDRANAYTAGREDTAYQRLVGDLRAAGLNPAMMFGSSASTSSSGSAGTISPSSGANNRIAGQNNNVRKLLLSYMTYELSKHIAQSNLAYKDFNTFLNMLKLAGMASLAG